MGDIDQKKEQKKIVSISPADKACAQNQQREVPEFVRVAFLIGLSAFLSYLGQEIDSLIRNFRK